MDLKKLLAAIAACLLISGSALAVEAKIDGPSERPAGMLVNLNITATNADATQWIIPESLPKDVEVVTTKENLFFSSPKSGVFRFALIAASVNEDSPTKIDLDVATHTVTIVGSCGVAPPVDPVPDPNPNKPPPENDVSELRALSLLAAKELNDPTTAMGLAKVLASIEPSTVVEMQKKASASVEAVLLVREGESRKKDWLNVWRRPVNDAIRGDSPEGYVSELRAVADGLVRSTEGTAKPVPAKVRVVVYSRENCDHCKDWKADVQPILESWGWEIVPKISNGSVPTFVVTDADGVEHEPIVGAVGESRFRVYR